MNRDQSPTPIASLIRLAKRDGAPMLALAGWAPTRGPFSCAMVNSTIMTPWAVNPFSALDSIGNSSCGR